MKSCSKDAAASLCAPLTHVVLEQVGDAAGLSRPRQGLVLQPLQHRTGQTCDEDTFSVTLTCFVPFLSLF